ncbi:MAG: regulatory protein RecX [Bacteroidales bacterium]
MTDKNEDRQYALERMQILCSKSEKCTFDIEQKLDNYDLNEADKEWIINKLKEEKFVNNERYAGFFVRDKFRFNKWGKLKIKQALFLKKIPESIIQDALAQIDQDEYYNLASSLIQSKNKEIKDKNIFSRKARLFRFAAQKGFEPDIIYPLLNDLTEEN